jgi:excisionase family DNA binding protein
VTPPPGRPKSPLAEVSQPTTPPSYLLPAEVAELLRLSTKSIYRLAAEDPTMPVLRIGGSLRFPRERLLHWLRQREQGRAQPKQVTLKQLRPDPQVRAKSAPTQETECG